MYEFQIKNGLLNFASIFLLIWSVFGLVSAINECSFFLLNSNLVFNAVLRLKLLCSGFDNTRFHNFFFNFSYLQIFHVF